MEEEKVGGKIYHRLITILLLVHFNLLLFQAMSAHRIKNKMSVERQKGLTTGQLHTQLDPFLPPTVDVDISYIKKQVSNS